MQKTGNIRVIGLVIIVGIFVFALASSSTEKGIQFSASGFYTSAFEGPKASFAGVKYNGLTYTSSVPRGASASTFDSTINFDVDAKDSGKPNINGQMTSIYLPEDTLTNTQVVASPLGIWAGIPQEWFRSNAAVVQDRKMGMLGPGGFDPPWNWTIGEKIYQMKEFDMKFWVSFTSTHEGSEDPANKVPYGPIPFSREGYGYNVYNNLDVWIHIDIKPTWYIQGGGVGYFAIAKMALDHDVVMKAHDNNGENYDARTDEKVDPVSWPAVMSLYYGSFGSAVAPTQYSYEGKELNPQYFTSDLYVPIHLVNFGTWSGARETWYTYTRGDVATFAFDLKVFVFGEYRVQDIQKNPDQFEETTPVTDTGDGTLKGIIEWLSNPANIALLVVIGAFALILIFAPWLLIAIIALFKN